MSTANFPRFDLERSLRVPQVLVDQSGGAPMNRLLVADALGIKPGSSNFRGLLSASKSYGLTDGTEKATNISLRDLGRRAVSSDPSGRRASHVQALLSVDLFKRFFERFEGNKMPSSDMLQKILVADFDVPEERAESAARLVEVNGDFVGILRVISGSAHVLLDGAMRAPVQIENDDAAEDADTLDSGHEDVLDIRDGTPEPNAPPPTNPSPGPKAIFIGHGKKTGPLGAIKSMLDTFQVPYQVAVTEPNLGRPIPEKVRDTIQACGSAILIFTRDECLFDGDGQEVWRPSQNVVHELGATSFQYGDRIVIFKETGLDLPSNFSSVGYIEFEDGAIESKSMDLLKELVGFGILQVQPAS